MTKIYNQQINLIEEGRELCANKYFNDLLLALMRVESKYLLWPYGINKQMCERVFAYELYHQWRIVSEHYDYENLLINGEIRKDGSIYRTTKKIVYPDLILHEQQNNINQQIIACEIKTVKSVESNGGKQKILKDLIKLGEYVEELEYETCVFIQIKDPTNIIEKVIPYLKKRKNTISNSSKIYYIIKEDDSISYHNLELLLA